MNHEMMENLVEFSLTAVAFLQREVFFSAILFLPIGILALASRKRSPYLQFGLWTLLLVRLILPPNMAFEFGAGQLFSRLWPDVSNDSQK
ncbi:MAG: hypothetical protein ACE5I1_24910, partial [bacterium]